VVSILRLPTLASLWETTYGIAIMVKAGLLLVTMGLAGVNLARTRPRLVAAAERKDAALGTGAASLLRRLVTAEVVIVIGIIFAASILTSVPPPAKALGSVGAVNGHVGPGAVSEVFTHGPYKVAVAITPNRVALSNDFRVSITKGGKPVTGASVVAGFAMLDMEMGQQSYTMPARGPGVYSRPAPALVMVGHWGVSFDITPPGQAPFRITVIDKAEG
jgi:copper transport protein